MRDALNENPTVQLIVLGILALAVGVVLLPGMLGGKKEEEPASSTPATSSASLGSAPSTAAPAAGTPATGSAVAPATTPPAAAQPTGAFVPGPGLPQEVVVAYAQGKTVVLLVVRAGASDDRLVRRAVERLEGDSRLAVFVTRAKGIARYSRITQGVGVTQVPALIVVSPRDVSGEVPKAKVSYGFRSAESVVQAVRDAAYQGRNVGYDPG